MIRKKIHAVWNYNRNDIGLYRIELPWNYNAITVGPYWIIRLRFFQDIICTMELSWDYNGETVPYLRFQWIFNGKSTGKERIDSQIIKFWNCNKTWFQPRLVSKSNQGTTTVKTTEKNHAWRLIIFPAFMPKKGTTAVKQRSKKGASTSSSSTN